MRESKIQRIRRVECCLVVRGRSTSNVVSDLTPITLICSNLLKFARLILRWIIVALKDDTSWHSALFYFQGEQRID